MLQISYSRGAETSRIAMGLWMPFILSCAMVWILRVLFFPRPSVTVFLTSWLSPLQNLVSRKLAATGSFGWFYQAFLLSDDTLIAEHRIQIQSLFTLGLYHLVVVSGSHLQAISFCAKMVVSPASKKIHSPFILTAISAFCALNCFQPTCLRAYLSHLWSQKERAHPSQKWIGIYLLVLFLSPELVASLSLQLSMCGVLAVTIAPRVSSPLLTQLYRSAFCALLGSPLLFQMQTCMSWLVVAANTVALPVFEFLLMPWCLISLVVPFLRWPFQRSMEITFQVLDMLEPFKSPQVCLLVQRSGLCGTFYLFSLWCIWHFFSVRSLRRLLIKPCTGSTSSTSGRET